MLNPETLTLLDPACGSGHILVEAYEVLKAIYLERGYQARNIPRLILEKNLFGLDIDERAAQLAGFALLMKARADDRRLFNDPPKLNIYCLKSSKGLDAQLLSSNCRSVWNKHYGADEIKALESILNELLGIFEHGETFGSLIQIPASLSEYLPTLQRALELLQAAQQDYLLADTYQTLVPLVTQALILADQYDAVVANPPYMGGKGMNPVLKDFAKQIYPESKSDLFAMFIERGFHWCKPMGFNSMVTMQSWMFLSSFESLRWQLLNNRTINTMAHLGARAFSEISGEVVQTTAFVFYGQHFSGYKPAFFRLVEGQEEQKQLALRSGQNRFDTTVQDDFEKIPGSPVAYWAASGVIKCYEENQQIYEVSISDGQNITANNDKFLRCFWEVDCSYVDKQDKWVFYAKGGSFRKWYGNMEMIVDWSPIARAEYRSHPSARIIPEYLWFKEGITWTLITSAQNSFRVLPEGSTFDKGGSSIFLKNKLYLLPTISFLNSKVCEYILKILSSTLNLQVDEVRRLPFNPDKWLQSSISDNTKILIELHKKDFEYKEDAWEFKFNPFISIRTLDNRLSNIFSELNSIRQTSIASALKLETENNLLFIEAYGLQDELSPEVPEAQITLTRADREKDCQRLISYAIGCMMGRYSLDEPGLIYAHAGNSGFEPNRYQKFPADADGIVPITDDLWFDDDAAQRIREFLLAVWGAETLEENLAWLAASLGQKPTETPEETIRRYIASQFFKDHLQTYKKRPIYWLFSSGKQGAFQALVYLHRYNESTLPRMRAEYVVPLAGKIQARIEMLSKDAELATSTSTRNKLTKDIEKLKKKLAELLSYDEKLRYYADLRIQLDLDDGVKVNYGKFGDLLAEVKAVTGGSGDE